MSESDWGERYEKVHTTPRNYFLYFKLDNHQSTSSWDDAFCEDRNTLFFCLPVVVERHDHETRSPSNGLPPPEIKEMKKMFHIYEILCQLKVWLLSIEYRLFLRNIRQYVNYDLTYHSQDGLEQCHVTGENRLDSSEARQHSPHLSRLRQTSCDFWWTCSWIYLR